MFQLGDIVVIYRRDYNGIFSYLLTRLICFFTTEWWIGERTSNTYHAEMIYSPAENIGDVKDVSQQWPCVEVVGLGNLNRKAIFRLKNKPEDFDKRFDAYCSELIGQPYDYLKILSMSLFWLFRGTGLGRFFVRLLSLQHHDICSEFVARFYEDEIGVSCSEVGCNYTAPDAILDYCKAHPELFEVISDIDK